MEAVGGKAENSNGGKVAEKADSHNTKIALPPFFEADPPVFLTDSSGKTIPARQVSSR